VYSNTWDEPEHLAAGVELLDRGKYEYDTEHPPLGRLLIALGPWLGGAHSFGTPPPDGTQEGVDILYDGGHYWRTLTLARLGTMPFLVLLLIASGGVAGGGARRAGERRAREPRRRCSGDHPACPLHAAALADLGHAA
jgi:hypothetical protein